MTTSSVILVAATCLTGLSAGLFATFSYAVMPGLRRTDDDAFVSAMRGINVAIINPLFALVFVGSAAATTASLVVGWDEPTRAWVAAGLAAYVVGGFVVTGAVNVPLNDALESGVDDPRQLRRSFESRWVAWNHVRSVLTSAAFVCLVVAALKS